MTWQKAKEYCSGLGAGWRLPTSKEFQALWTAAERSWQLQQIVVMRWNAYWSSTTLADMVEAVYLPYTTVFGPPSQSNLVSCVRAAP
jgi:hypothetical protein